MLADKLKVWHREMVLCALLQLPVEKMNEWCVERQEPCAHFTSQRISKALQWKKGKSGHYIKVFPSFSCLKHGAIGYVHALECTSSLLCFAFVNEERKFITQKRNTFNNNNNKWSVVLFFNCLFHCPVLHGIWKRGKIVAIIVVVKGKQVMPCHITSGKNGSV